MSFDIAVVIGRFQPFHLGHHSLVQKALEKANHVILLIGSANRPRSVRNPWTFEERKEMITGSFPKHVDRIHCLPLSDSMYDDKQWEQNAYQQVASQIEALNLKDPSICLVGHNKDDSSYYLKIFSNWTFIHVENYNNLNATSLRHLMFSFSFFKGPPEELKGLVKKSVFCYLKNFYKTFKCEDLLQEFDLIRTFEANWDFNCPPSFVEVNTIVVCSGQVLLVRRRNLPGKGLWAIPGDFLKEQDTLTQGMVGSLNKVLRLQLSLESILKLIKSYVIFDHPNRSLHCRAIAHAYLLELDSFPDIKGSEDVDMVRWLPISSLGEIENQMFGDHADILHLLLKDNRSL